MTKTRILVVEDESIVARDIRNMLQSMNYEVIGVVSNAPDAVKNACKTSPHLVLMDLMLQGEMSGVEAANKIYTHYNIPVVFLTAHSDESILQIAKKSEPFGYLLKPFEERELKSTIEVALYKFQMEMKLKERERFLTTILQSIDEGVIATDKKGCIKFMNPFAEKLTEWDYTDVLGKPLEGIFKILSMKTGRPLRIPINKILKGNRYNLSKEAMLQSQSDKKTCILLNTSPIYNDAENISGIVIAFSDISRQKHIEEELRKSWLKQKSTMEGTVQAMAYTIETRDPYTAGHQRRVTKLACAIACKMGVSADTLDGVRMAGSLHDLGKIYVPAEILSKPGKISEVEFNIIKTHPQVGYDILKSIEFSWPVAEIVLQHHERIDGTGYPRGLKGPDILLEAKILSVADVVEAMASHRPYRAALKIEQALDEITKNKGTFFAAEVVEACLQVFADQEFKFD